MDYVCCKVNTKTSSHSHQSTKIFTLRFILVLTLSIWFSDEIHCMTVSKIEYYTWKFMSSIKDYISYTDCTNFDTDWNKPPPPSTFTPLLMRGEHDGVVRGTGGILSPTHIWHNKSILPSWISYITVNSMKMWWQGRIIIIVIVIVIIFIIIIIL